MGIFFQENLDNGLDNVIEQYGIIQIFWKIRFLGRTLECCLVKLRDFCVICEVYPKKILKIILY